jgi:vacuolar-type H+-ATPase subunit F/Vma7
MNRGSHCFALNGNIFDPECDGLEGILEAYQNSLKHVQLYGPTHFNEILSVVNDMAEHLKVSQSNQKY